MSKKIILTVVVAVLLCTAGIVVWCHSDKKIKEPFSSSHDTVWSWWESAAGGSGRPEMVERCLANWKNVGKINDFRVLTPDTVHRYIPYPEYQKICNAAGSNMAIKSDFIALYLLFNWGGTWMDATNYLHSPLSDWCSGNKPVLYRARRYSAGGRPCIETFFIHAGNKGYPFFGKWYSKLFQVAPRVDDWCNQLKQQYPRIADGMEYGNYLWVYLVGKKLLMDNPQLLEGSTVLDSEDGPWKESVDQNWDVDKTCHALSARRSGGKSTHITKLDNALRKKCSVSIVPT